MLNKYGTDSAIASLIIKISMNLPEIQIINTHVSSSQVTITYTWVEEGDIYLQAFWSAYMFLNIDSTNVNAFPPFI